MYDKVAIGVAGLLSVPLPITVLCFVLENILSLCQRTAIHTRRGIGGSGNGALPGVEVSFEARKAVPGGENF